MNNVNDNYYCFCPARLFVAGLKGRGAHHGGLKKAGEKHYSGTASLISAQNISVFTWLYTSGYAANKKQPILTFPWIAPYSLHKALMLLPIRNVGFHCNGNNQSRD